MAEARQATPALTGSDPQPEHPAAFISYSHLDLEFAVRLRDALGSKGKDAWLDENEIRGGERWSEELERAIQMADAFLFLLSPHSAGSRECRAELDHALKLNKRILPLRVAETPLGALPDAVRAYQFIPSRRLFAEDFDAALAQLITEIETDRDWVREHTEWSDKAVQWERHRHDRSYLLDGSELEAAESWRSRAAGKRPGLSTLQSEFIDASRQWATRRLHRTRSLVSVALAVALALSVVAFVLRQQAVTEGQVAKSGELSAQSLLQLNTDPQLSLLLAARAARVSETPAALDALRTAIPQNHLLRTFASASNAPLLDARWSADGTMVATAGQDGYARVYDTATGRLLRRFQTSTANSGGVAFAEHDQALLTWSAGVIHLWKLATGGLVRTFTDPSFDQLADVEVSPSGTMMATAAGPGGFGAALLWTLDSSRPLHVLRRAGAQVDGAAIPSTMAFSPDGRLVAGGSENGTATVWDTRTGAGVRYLRLGTTSGMRTRPYVFTVAFSPDGARLLTTQEDVSNRGRTVIWKLSRWTTVVVPGTSSTWSPDGHYVATTQPDGSAAVYAAITGQQFSARLNGNVAITGVSRFGLDTGGQPTQLITGSRSGQVSVWNLSSGAASETLAGDAGLVTPVGISPDGAHILTWSADGSARLWDSGRIVAQPSVRSHAVAVADRSLQALDSGYAQRADLLSPVRAIVSAAGLRVLDARTNAVQAVVPAGGRSFDNAAFDAAGRLMLVMTSTLGQHGFTAPAELRGIPGGRVLRVLSGPGSRALGGAVSPDGRLVAAVDAKGVIGVWSAATGHQLLAFRRHEVAHATTAPQLVDLKFSPDGRLLLSADQQGRTFVWVARTGRVRNDLRGPPVPLGQYLGMGGAISPDDRLVVTTRSWDDNAQVYRVGHPQLLTTLRGHSSGIEDAAFNPAGNLIVTASADDTVRVWDTQHSGALLTVPMPTTVLRVGFSADGLVLVTDTAFPYATLPCAICGGFSRLLTLALQRETRTFTAEERSLFQTG
ncbi:MAG: toll/interleukin-1 receptor domain-containing protein [Solirubrobacteraceae bacterium]